MEKNILLSSYGVTRIATVPIFGQGRLRWQCCVAGCRIMRIHHSAERRDSLKQKEGAQSKKLEIYCKAQASERNWSLYESVVGVALGIKVNARGCARFNTEICFNLACDRAKWQHHWQEKKSFENFREASRICTDQILGPVD